MSKSLIKNKDDFIVTLNCWAVAMMLVSFIITRTLASISLFKNTSNNVFVLLAVAICMAGSALLAKKVYIPLPSVFIFLLIFTNFIITLVFHGDETTTNAIQFIFFAVIPIYLISQKLDPEKILRYSLYLSLISIPIVNVFFQIQYEKYSQAYMGNIFAILPTVIIAMIHFKLYRKNSNIVVKIAYIYNLYLLIKICLIANRGAVVCVLFCFMVLMINAYDDENRIKLKPLKIIMFVILFIIGVVVLINALPILESLQTFLKNTFNFVPSFISKMIKYINEGDVTDGRTNINEFVIDAILKKPVFGHGIETFENYVRENTTKNWQYPHQYIWQYLFEGGVVFSIIPIYLSLSLTVKVLSTRIVKKDEFAICCTLVCLCIPKLLLSTDPWDSTTIWMLITYSLLYIFKTNSFFKAYAQKLNFKQTD